MAPRDAHRFAMLTLESANRVYGQHTGDLLAAELAAISGALHASVDDIDQRRLGGVDYVTFSMADLDTHDRTIVSNLSAVRALYHLRSDGALVPLELAPIAYFDSDLVTIQRYPGKTNEQFTHLLLNLAVAASTAAAQRSAEGLAVRVLDPVAGRGSTLNRALTSGYDATGIEIAAADADQYRTFISTYLKNHRVKHKLTQEKIRKGPLAGTDRFVVQIAGTQRLEFFRGDTERTGELLSPRSVDVVVGDLPYGVQHRAASSGSKARSPHDLVAACLDGWCTVMRGGASIGLAWNTKTLARSTLAGLLADQGLDVVDHPVGFEHVVDRSITRDVIVAVKR